VGEGSCPGVGAVAVVQAVEERLNCIAARAFGTPNVRSTFVSQDQNLSNADETMPDSDPIVVHNKRRPNRLTQHIPPTVIKYLHTEMMVRGGGALRAGSGLAAA